MGRPRKFAEEHVVAAVREQFAEHGFTATSLEDLTRATGLGKGSLYGAFGDKRQLFELAFAEYCTAVTEGITDRLAGPDATALKRLRAYATFIAANSCAEVNPRGCFLAKTTAELAATEPSVAEQALTTFRELEKSIADCIDQAKRHGDIRDSTNTKALAGLFLSSMRGIESLGKAGMTEAELRAIARAATKALTTA